MTGKRGLTRRERANAGWFLRHRKMSLRRFLDRRARAVRFRFSRCGQLHSYQFAHPSFFHGHAVKNIGLGNGALIMGDDDELALRDKPLQHLDKAIDVGFIERSIHFSSTQNGLGRTM
jgi:hypothetical protein